jgi:hypothetical protein
MENDNKLPTKQSELEVLREEKDKWRERYFNLSYSRLMTVEMEDHYKQQIESLERWKKEELEVWGPVLEFMRTTPTDIKLGESISKKVLEILKTHYLKSD